MEVPTVGHIKTIPAGNGIVSQSLNGVIGEGHDVARDQNLENQLLVL